MLLLLPGIDVVGSDVQQAQIPRGRERRAVQKIVEKGSGRGCVITTLKVIRYCQMQSRQKFTPAREGAASDDPWATAAEGSKR